MPKVDVFCKIKKKIVKMDKKLADALVKMKRASYDTKVENVYPDKMMVAKPVEVKKVESVEEVEAVEEIETAEKPVKKTTLPNKKKKNEINPELQQEIDALNALKDDSVSD